MSFVWPLALLALLVVPLGMGAYILAQRRRPKYAIKFTNLDLLANVVEKTPNYQRHIPPLLYLAAVAALIFAVARPQGTEDVPKEEATVILLMDVSGSMKATDVKPSRLDAAKESANALLDALPTKFQVALVTFSDNVKTVVPPTEKRDEVRKGLDTLVPVRGTAMGDGIEQALDIARPLQDAAGGVTPASPANGAVPTPTQIARAAGIASRPAVIVLLSDGANSTGFANPIDAANDAKDRGVAIFTVALGTQAGVVDITDNFRRTQRINVPPDPETLKKVADITGGRFFEAPSAEDLQGIYKDLGSQIGFDPKETEIGYWFAALGALFVVAAGGLSLFWFNRFP